MKNGKYEDGEIKNVTKTRLLQQGALEFPSDVHSSVVHMADCASKNCTPENGSLDQIFIDMTEYRWSVGMGSLVIVNKD